MVRPLESKNQLSSKCTNGTVKEFAEAWAIQVVLHISRIGVIEQVEDAQSDFHLPLLRKGEPELSVCLKIERVEVAKATIVSWADKLALFVYQRVGEPGVNIQDRHQRHLPRHAQLSQCKEPIRYIEGQRATCIRLDHRQRIVSKKLIEVVEIAGGLRPHVGGVQGLTSYLITAGNLKLAVKSSPAIRQGQEVAACRGFRIENQVMDSVSLLVGNPNQKFLQYLTIKFSVPGFAARISQSAGDDIGIGKGRSHFSCRIESYKRAIREERERSRI